MFAIPPIDCYIVHSGFFFNGMNFQFGKISNKPMKTMSEKRGQISAM